MPAPTIDTVRSQISAAYSHLGPQQNAPKTEDAQKKLVGSANVLAQSLAQLDPKQLSDADAKRVADIAKATDKLVQGDAGLSKLLGSTEGAALLKFTQTQAGRSTQSAMGAGAVSVQALFEQTKSVGGKEGKLTPKQLEAQKSNPTLQSRYQLAKFFADPSHMDGSLKTFESSIGQLKELQKQTQDPAAKKAIGAEIKSTKANMKWLEGIKTTLGIESAGVVDDPLFFQILAHTTKDENGKPLPSSLSKAQKAKLDSMGKASKLDLGKLDSPALPQLDPANPAANLVTALAGGAKGEDIAAQLHKLVDGRTPETPAERASADANLQKLRTTNPAAYDTINSFRMAQAEDDMKSSQTFSEIMGLVNSGMPIEVVIMLVMLKLTERQEDKFKLKLKELATFEKLEQINKKVSEEFETRIADAGAKGVLQATQDKRDIAKAEAEKAGTPLSAEDLAKIQLSPEDAEKASRAAVAVEEPKIKAALDAKRVKPAEFGLKAKSTTILMQEMQAEQQIFMQVMQALAAVMRQLQDLVMTPIRNIR